MKILVLGAGAVGGYYGARLIEGGADVAFLVRTQRAARIDQAGLVVESAVAPFAAPVKTTLEAVAGDRHDVVLLTCKSFDLPSALDAITPAVDGGACVVPLLNGLSVYDTLDARFGEDRVLGGVCYIATMLGRDGTIVHLAPTDRFVVGARVASQRAIAQAVHDAMDRTPGVRLLSSDIAQDLWDKWATVCTAAAVTSLMRGTVADILRTADGRAVMQQAIGETRAVAAASGHSLSDAVVAQMQGLLLDPARDWAASMMRDIGQGMPRIEADAIVGDMLRRADALGIDAPMLRAAFVHLQVYEVQRRGLAG